jgi:hypothetical protein
VQSLRKPATYSQRIPLEEFIAEVQVTVAKAQVRAGDMAGALRTTDLVQDTGLKNMVLSDIAAVQMKAGDPSAADGEVELEIEVAGSVAPPQLRVEVFSD